MAMIVEWLPYFNMVFETRWEIPSDSKVMPLISNIQRFFLALKVKKKELKVPPFSRVSFCNYIIL